MSARFFLNELKTADRQLAGADPGTWKADSAFLDRFANDIHVTGEVADRIVNSVPSVFARPIQFRAALFDSKHPMHETVKRQWRGLLALFGLKKALGLQLEVKPYSLRKENEIGENDRDRRFAMILRSQLPKPAGEWESWLLLYCNGELVGATSPWTILYTPASYRLSGGASWIDDNGLLDDPLRYLYDSGSNNEELAILNAWIGLLVARQPWGFTSDSDQYAGHLRRLLVEWRDEITAKVPARAGTMSLQPTFSAQAGALYKDFLSAADVEAVSTSVSSDLLLDDTDRCGVVVLSRTGLRNPQWAKKRIDGAVRVGDVDLYTLAGPSSAGGWRSTKGTQVSKPYIIAEDYFLPDRILKLPLTADAISAGSREYVLPLRPAFLKHFDVERIAEIVSLEAGGGDVTVRLRLPLQNGEWLTVEKAYPIAQKVDSIPERTLIPALAVWPDFYDPEWPHNEAIVAQKQPRSDAIQFAPVYAQGETDTMQVYRPETPAVCVWECSTPPLGFAVSIRNSEGRREDVGLVLRANVRTPLPTGAEWTVGVDFGTSNTQVYVRTPLTEGPLVLHGRSVSLVAATEDNTRAWLENAHHEGPVHPPFPTLLRRSEVVRVVGGRPVEMLRGVVTPNVDVAVLAENAQKYVRDLKWTADAEAQKQFLQQLSLMIVTEARAEGARAVHFEWSYPLSLPIRIRKTMDSFWSSIGKSLTSAEMAVDADSGIAESDAVCRCVAVNGILPILAGNLSISIDIGGGSTDIGFWSDKTLIDRLSFNIAGNDIIRLASKHEELNRALLKSAAGGDIADQRMNVFQTQPEIMWNALLTAGIAKQGVDRRAALHGHPFVTQMGMRSSADWRKCRTGVLLAFGGILFYAGIHSARHMKQASRGIAVYVGGKGSALLSWLGRPEEVREVLRQYFDAGFKVAAAGAATGLDLYGPAVESATRVNAKVFLKDEVASGLLEGDALQAALGPQLDLNSTAVGEVNWVDDRGQEVPWHDLMSGEKLGRLQPPANDNSSFVTYFLKQVLRPSAEQNDLDSEGLLRLQINQNWTINDIRRRADEQVMQPIFAYELKNLIRNYGEHEPA